jgi:hypothetical protein
MKTIADFVTIGSLILTLWMVGDLAKVKQGKNPPAAPVTAEKLGANHNEMLVKDTGPVKTEALPIHLQESIHYDAQPVHPRNCDWLECGSENTASLKVDTQKVRETKPQASWLTSVWEFFFKGTKPPCEDWGCGTNHNEILARDDR